jgi:hypothetical protein
MTLSEVRPLLREVLAAYIDEMMPPWTVREGDAPGTMIVENWPQPVEYEIRFNLNTDGAAP